MKYVNYIAMSIVNLVMLMATALKLSGNEVALQSFVDLGLASWFGTFIGVCELLGEIYYHVMFPPIEAGIPAAAVLLCCVYIIRRKRTGVLP